MAKSDDKKGTDSKGSKSKTKKKPAAKKPAAKKPAAKKKAAKKASEEEVAAEEVVAEAAEEAAEEEAAAEEAAAEEAAEEEAAEEEAAEEEAAEEEAAEEEAAAEEAAAEEAAEEEAAEEEAAEEAADEAVNANVIPMAASTSPDVYERAEELIIPLKPNSEGLFDEDKIDESLAEGVENASVFARKKSKIMTLVGFIALGAIVTVIFLGLTVEKYNDDMTYFLGQGTGPDGQFMSLEDYKRQNAEKAKQAAQEEDAASQNRYGTITLSYYPPTAEVRVRKLVLEQDGLAGTRKWKTPEKFKKNTSLSPQENQKNCEVAGGLWIREKEKCAEASEIELGQECAKDTDCYSKDLFEIYGKNLTIELIAEATEKKRNELLEAAKAQAKDAGGILAPEVLDGLDEQLKLMKAAIASEVSMRVRPLVEKARDTLKGVCQERSLVKLCKNPTTVLIPGQSISSIPLNNLPLFEAEKYESGDKKGSVSTVQTFEYVVEWSLDGYKSHTEVLTRLSSRGAESRADGWKMGAGNQFIWHWDGVDLEPKIGTLRKNYLAFKADLTCKANSIGLEQKMESTSALLAVVPAWVTKRLKKLDFRDPEMYAEKEKFLQKGREFGPHKQAQAQADSGNAAVQSESSCNSICTAAKAARGSFDEEEASCTCEIENSEWWRTKWDVMRALLGENGLTKWEGLSDYAKDGLQGFYNSVVEGKCQPPEEAPAAPPAN